MQRKPRKWKQVYFGKNHIQFNNLSSWFHGQCVDASRYTSISTFISILAFTVISVPKVAKVQGQGKKFKKKSRSSSSSSDSQHGGGLVGLLGGVFCDHCGGKYYSTNCTVVHGSCHVCEQIGHYARVFTNARRQQFSSISLVRVSEDQQLELLYRLIYSNI